MPSLSSIDDINSNRLSKDDSINLDIVDINEII